MGSDSSPMLLTVTGRRSPPGCTAAITAARDVREGWRRVRVSVEARHARVGGSLVLVAAALVLVAVVAVLLALVAG